jgi:hypothetical protein
MAMIQIPGQNSVSIRLQKVRRIGLARSQLQRLIANPLSFNGSPFAPTFWKS